MQKAVEQDPEGKDMFANRARAILNIITALVKELQQNGPEAMEELRRQMLEG